MKNIVTVITVFFTSLHIAAQSPDWAVNASDYQYSMTFTVFLNVNGNNLTSTKDKVGAFVKGVSRGEATVVYNTKAKKHVAYLTVFANKVGETISFKIYDSAANKIVDALQTQTFIVDGNVGGIFQSYSIAKPSLNNQAEFITFSIKDVTPISKKMSSNRIEIIVPSDTNITSLIPEFTVRNGAKVFVNKILQTSGSTMQDFSNSVDYQMLSEDESVLKNYTIVISKEVIATPPTITLSSTQSKVKQAPVVVSLEASESINGLTKADFDAKNTVVTNIKTTDNINYAITIVPIQQGAFSLKLLANTVKNASNKNNTESNTVYFTYDNDAPKIASIKRKVPSTISTSSGAVTFNVIFTENVQNVSVDDFTSVSNAVISVNPVNSKTYTVTVSNIVPYTGTVFLTVKNSTNIQDLSGNQLIVSTYKSYEN